MAELVDASDSKPDCRQAGLVFARMCRFANRENMYYVYAIKSVGYNYIYVGLTKSLVRRLKQHNNGSNQSTKAYKPFILIFSVEANSLDEARKKEKYFKSGIGKEYLKSLIK